MITKILNDGPTKLFVNFPSRVIHFVEGKIEKYVGHEVTVKMKKAATRSVK